MTPGAEGSPIAGRSDARELDLALPLSILGDGDIVRALPGIGICLGEGDIVLPVPSGGEIRGDDPGPGGNDCWLMRGEGPGPGDLPLCEVAGAGD